jgi:glycerol-3-phosphate dehydrogenase subunit C
MGIQQENISVNNFEQCIKCTVCTSYCPVTAVNPDYPGPKQAGPDGERYRLKRPYFYDEALKYCLNCKRCEVACPSNVKIGDIIQSARIKYSKKSPSLRDTILASTDFMGGIATTMAPVVNATLALSPVKAVMDATIGVGKHRTLPKYTSQKFTTWFKKHAQARQSEFKKQVSYFHGCYVNYNYPQLGKDFVAVMNALGYGVRLMEKERCCGVAKIANKLIKQARRDAEINISEIRSAVKENRRVLATSSTCAFTMRDEYPHFLKVDNEDVRKDILLATRFIYQVLEEGKLKLVFKPDFKLNVAYHTPCHMEKLGWSIYSTGLLAMIPGVKLTLLDSQCCGIAGTYGFKKENYEYSQAIGEGLFRQIRDNNPDVVATDCETCKWQIEMSTGYTVMNPISILAQALDIEKTMDANK